MPDVAPTSSLDVQRPRGAAYFVRGDRVTSVSLPRTPLAATRTRTYARADAPAVAGHHPMEHPLDPPAGRSSRPALPGRLGALWRSRNFRWP
jgi:hypothetical protein